MIVLSLALIVLILVREYIMGVERREWLSERRELLNRVQAPDRLPSLSNTDFVVPEREVDEFALVGSIGELTVE